MAVGAPGGREFALVTRDPLTADALARGLAAAGLVQFGRFEQSSGAPWPVAIHLDWLPSYPEALRQAARALAPHLAALNVDRVLAAPGALPVAVALSLETGTPVVYAAADERDYTAAFAIEGAYDVGHPTALLSNVLPDAAQARAISELARRVGLNVQAVVGLLDLGLGARAALGASGWTVRAALALPDALPVLEAAGVLPPVMRARVEAWMEDCRSDPACD